MRFDVHAARPNASAPKIVLASSVGLLLLLTGVDASGQTASPRAAPAGSPPAFQAVTLAPKTSEEAQRWRDQNRARSVGLGAQALSAQAPVPAPASVTELARALNNDVDQIYEFVHNNIEFSPRYGALKGPEGTILDGRGNSFDQAALMVALLRSGDAPYTASYVRGKIRLSADQVMAWLDVDSLQTGCSLLAGGGIPVACSPTAAEVEHVWVKVDLTSTGASCGSSCIFDPSYKTYTNVAGIDLPTAMGYSQSSLLASAKSGATITPSYVQNINRAGLRNTLGDYANSLVAHIKSNKPAGTLEEVIGGRLIEPVTAPVRQSQHPLFRSQLDAWSGNIPDLYRTQIIVYSTDVSGFSTPLWVDAIYGKRLTVTTNVNKQLVLKLDGVVQDTSTTGLATASSPYTIKVDVHHPYDLDRTAIPMSAVGGGTYLIVNGWDLTSRHMIETHRQKLQANKAVGIADDDERVLGESLAVIGATWLAETSRALAIGNQIANTAILHHHTIGVVGYVDAPYIDLPGGQAGLIRKTAGASGDADVLASYFNLGGLFSAAEWGSVEQTMPVGAVSTIKLIDLANAQGDRIFEATGANWTSIRGILDDAGQGYSGATLDDIEANYIDKGFRLFIPEHGNLTQGSWTGYSFLGVGANLNLAYPINRAKGGFPDAPLNFVDMNNASIATLQYIQSPAASVPVSTTFTDPIDPFTGNFLYSHDDLTVGAAAHPFGLGFQRSYLSGARLSKGPLGYGWMHNFDVKAVADSDPFQALGEDSPVDAAAAIVGLYAAFDLFKEPSKTKENVVIATLVQRWLMDGLIDNAVTIVQPQNTQQFVKLADGTWNPPPGVAATLTKPSSNFLYRTKDGIELEFDSTHENRIKTWKNPHDVTVTFAYDGSHNLTSVTNGIGRTLTLTYDGSQIDTVSDGSRTVSFDYTSGQLTKFTDAAGKFTVFEYETLSDGSPGRLTKIFYPAFPSTAFVENTYDALGRVKEQKNPIGQTFEIRAAGYRAEEKDPFDAAHVTYFNARGKVVKEVDRTGRTTLTEYDGHDRVTKATLPEGNTVEYTYDDKHNVLNVTATAKPGSPEFATPIVRSFTYEPTFSKVVSATDALGRVTNFTIDPTYGDVLQIQQPAVAGVRPTTSFTYTDQGQVKTATDPTGKVTQYDYDGTKKDQLIKVTEDLGNLALVTELGYDDDTGDVTSRTDPRGFTATLLYDDLRRLIETTAPSPLNAIETKNTYDDDGNLTKVERATGATPAWQTTTATYNAAGKKLTETDPLGNRTTYAYDDALRLSTVTDAENRTTTFSYDAAGRLFRVTDALSQVREEHSYTQNGLKASLKDANGNVTTWSYDGHDRVLQVLYPDESSEGFTYDANGNVQTRTNRAGQTTTLSYDPLNRLSTKAVPSLPTISYAYDLAGRVLRVEDSVGAFVYDYDTAGRNESVTRPDGKVVSYEYDENSNRTRVTWPDNFYVTYSYDELNRMKEIRQSGTTLLARYDWDDLSRRSRLTFGNGTTASYNYRYNDDLASIVHRLKASSVIFAYGYNKVGQRVSQTVSDDRFLYRPAGTETVDYSANNLNQYALVSLSGSAPVSLSYDANGNLTSDGTWTFGYDAENRLTSATRSSPSVNAAYAYDVLGRRAAKTVDGIITQYLSDGNQEIAEYDGDSGTLLRRFVYGVRIDEPLAQVTRSGQKFYYRADALGSIVASEEQSSGFVQRYGYGPFGEAASATGHPYRYTGRRLDDETGLYYYRARMYSVNLGRFLQTDPIGYEGGINLYAYVGNDPLNLVDPTGLFGSALSGIGNTAWQMAQSSVQPYVAIYNRWIVDPFYAVANALANSPLGDSGVWATVQSVPGLQLVGAGGRMLAGGLRGLASLGRWPTAAKTVTEGIYEFTAASGKTYVGQSGNIATRLEQHIASGKLLPGTPIATTEVLGGKTAREIAEQLRINELGGIKNLENIRNPIGPNRQHLLP